MDEDILTRLRAFDNGYIGTHYNECWHNHPICAILKAADEIEQLRKQIGEERQMANTFEALAAESAEEINRLTQEVNRLTKERNQWQAEAAGLSQDISNAEDEIKLLQEEINDLRLQIVAMSIPTAGKD